MKHLKRFLLLFSIFSLIPASPKEKVKEPFAVNSIADIGQYYNQYIKAMRNRYADEIGDKEGRIYVTLTLLPDGNTYNVNIESSTNPELNELALKFVPRLPKLDAGFIKDSIRIIVPIDLFKEDFFITRNNLSYPAVRKINHDYPLGEFPGGNDGFVQYIYANLKRSVLKEVKNETHTVKFNFRINKEGKAEQIKFDKLARNPIINGEIKRLFKQMPPWSGADQLDESNNRYLAELSLGIDDKDLHFKVLKSRYENYYDLRPPMLPEGENALSYIIRNEMKYPQAAIQQGIYGKVIGRLKIDKDGNITERDIYKNIHPLLDKEALRLLTLIPSFIPATLDGYNIPYTYYVPLNFRLPARQ
ncbi:MAG: TonB family protein [Bacteroidales bacterium]